MEYSQSAVAAGSELEGVTMSFGKMNTLVDIVSTTPVKDTEGFVVSGDTILATVRAYREEKHGNESWANRAALSSASALFRFRKHPTLVVTTISACGSRGCPPSCSTMPWKTPCWGP